MHMRQPYIWSLLIIQAHMFKMLDIKRRKNQNLMLGNSMISQNEFEELIQKQINNLAILLF